MFYLSLLKFFRAGALVRRPAGMGRAGVRFPALSVCQKNEIFKSVAPKIVLGGVFLQHLWKGGGRRVPRGSPGGPDYPGIQDSLSFIGPDGRPVLVGLGLGGGGGVPDREHTRSELRHTTRREPLVPRGRRINYWGRSRKL